MALAHSVLAALLVCSATALAQNPDQVLASPTKDAPQAAPSVTMPAPTENAAKSPLDRMRTHEFKVDPKSWPVNAKDDNLIARIPFDGIPDDTLCYTMRSYVVARDSKDSDSTHPVGYATCQNATRYRLRTAEGRGDPSKAR